MEKANKCPKLFIDILARSIFFSTGGDYRVGATEKKGYEESKKRYEGRERARIRPKKEVR